MALTLNGKLLQRRPSVRPFVSLFHTTKALLSEMNDPIEHATGIEKRELLAKAGGNKDPFMLNTIIKRGPGTKDQPNLIPSAFEGRLMGCMCCGNRFPQWMWLEKGCPKRCECGFWFKLQEVKPL